MVAAGGDGQLPVSLGDYERLAGMRLDASAWAYVAGGAGDEITLGRNRAALDGLLLMPRVLSPRMKAGGHTRIEVLGRTHAHPIMLAPVAYQRLAHPDGETGTAMAAAAQGANMILSAMASTPMEQVVAAGPACRWFQLYLQETRERTLSLVRRAERAGFEALVVTVDAPVNGIRNREHRASFRLPVGISAVNLERLPPMPQRSVPEDGSAVFDGLMAVAPDWSDIGWLAGATRLPVVLKGILSPDDAERAVAEGVAAIVVSNHGGRTLDTVPAAIEVLPAIVERVGSRVPLLVDGGIRRGTDVLKALALGAVAVLVGRPVMHGLAVGGARGVSHVLRILRDELEVAMALCGCATVADIGPGLIYRGGPPGGQR
jgi:4-hydroxymandelate oxidase